MDKSAFQGLSAEEHGERRFMFMENVTPVLLHEIAGDLAKTDGDRDPVGLVQTLAKKFGGSGGKVNIGWDIMCFGSLLGEGPPMTGQIVLDPSVIQSTRRDADGVSVYMGPAAENYAIMRWAQANFSEDERQFASEFRAKVRARTTTDVRGRLSAIDLPTVRAVEDLPTGAAEFLTDRDRSLIVVHWMMDQLRPLARLGARVAKARQHLDAKWRRSPEPPWNDAPYAYHCAKALLMLVLGETVLSARPTNRVDLEYLFYLPFCHVFVSDDKLHKQLAPSMLAEYQSFVPLSQFKADLRRSRAARKAADHVSRRRLDRCFGSRPWPAPGSVLWTLWEKYSPWQRTSGNRAITLSADELRIALDEAERLVKIANADLVSLTSGK